MDKKIISSFRGEITDIRILPQEREGIISYSKSSRDIDLIQMARWAQNYLANNPVREVGWQCRFSFWGLHMPVFDPWPYCVTRKPLPQVGLIDPIVEGDTDSRMAYAYIYMREMAGEYDEVSVAEREVQKRVLGYIHSDGLSWIIPVVVGIPIDESNPERWSFTWTTGKSLWTVSELYRLTGDLQYKKLGRKIFEGIRKLASWDNRRAYYEGGGGAWKDGKWYPISTLYPFVVEPVVRYWEVTKDDEALEFAQAFANGMIDNLQPNLGIGAVQPDGSYQSHAHSQLHAISGVAHLGAITKDSRYIDWARRVYEYVRNKGTDYGWFPESFTLEEHMSHTEVCLISDMVYMATWLAEAGNTEYFDHVERYIRNILSQCQFFVTPEYEDLYRTIHSHVPNEKVEEQLRIMKSIQGGFVASPTPNDLVDENSKHHGTAGNPPLLLDLMGCCPPEGMRALRTAWRHTVTEKSDGVYINMMLPCDHKEASVKTWLPDNGQIIVIPHLNKDVYIRPPVWAPMSEIRVYRQKHEVIPLWKGDYIKVENTVKEEEIAITFPMVLFVQRISIEAGSSSGVYQILWKGNTVINIEPKGKYLPMFKELPTNL